MAVTEAMTLASSPWPDRPETDRRSVGYLWVPSDALFLPAVAEVCRGGLLAAGRTVVPTADVVDAVLATAERLLPEAAADRSWLVELETDDSDVFVRLWMRLAAPQDVDLGGAPVSALEHATGSYDVHREGTELLVVLQVELAA